MKEYRVDNLTCPLDADDAALDIKKIGESDEAITEALNERAEEGWELHSFIPRVYAYQGQITTALTAVFVRECVQE